MIRRFQTTHMVPFCALLALCGVLSNCASLPKLADGHEKAPALSEAEAAHQAFIAQENYQSLIYRNDKVIEQLNPENASIHVSLSNRRAKVFAGDEVAIDTPVSPGQKTHPTPTGTFSIIGKNKDHRSNIYGRILDASGDVVATGDQRKHKIPEGGKYVGTAMPYWMRLTNTGIGMHVGYVPNYAASHGCIRLPSKIAPVIYDNTKVGTPVVIEE